jgi:hypothetical protein
MSTDIKTRGAGLKKQRSFQLDDETFALVEAAERRTGLSKSAVIGRLLWAEYGGNQQPAAPAQPEMAPARIEEARREAPTLKTPLPPDSADSFAVKGNRVEHKKDKPKKGETNVNFGL